jgi:hypothetical protein
MTTRVGLDSPSGAETAFPPCAPIRSKAMKAEESEETLVASQPRIVAGSPCSSENGMWQVGLPHQKGQARQQSNGEMAISRGPTLTLFVARGADVEHNRLSQSHLSHSLSTRGPARTSSAFFGRLSFCNSDAGRSFVLYAARAPSATPWSVLRVHWGLDSS